VESINKTSENLSISISNTMEALKKTDEIVHIINKITSQIKILGINAAIEAARAGEYGRGFSVVADEIGKLTNSSKNATKNIVEILEVIKNDISGLETISAFLNKLSIEQSEIVNFLVERE